MPAAKRLTSCARFRTFLGLRSLRTVGLGDLSDVAATLSGPPATRRRTLSALKALLSPPASSWGAAAQRRGLPCGSRASSRAGPSDASKSSSSSSSSPPSKTSRAIGAIVEALYGTGARVAELVQLECKQLVPDTEGKGGYVTLYGKNGSRTIRVGRRTWEALQRLAEGKEPDDRIVAITDERIRQILTAAAKVAGLKKKLSPHWLRHAHGSHAHQRGASAATIRDSLAGHASLSTTDLYLSSSPTDGSSLYLKFRASLRWNSSRTSDNVHLGIVRK